MGRCLSYRPVGWVAREVLGLAGRSIGEQKKEVSENGCKYVEKEF